MKLNKKIAAPTEPLVNVPTLAVTHNKDGSRRLEFNTGTPSIDIPNNFMLPLPPDRGGDPDTFWETAIHAQSSLKEAPIEPLSEREETSLRKDPSFIWDTKVHIATPENRLSGFSELGSGGFGSVEFLRGNFDSGETAPDIIIKKLHTPKEPDPLLEESKMMVQLRSLGCDFVPEVYGYSKTDGLAMAYAGRPLSETDLKNPTVIRQILHIISKLDELGFNHHDLKPDNICIQDGKVMLIDFGQCQKRDSDTLIPPGTLQFISPYQTLRKGTEGIEAQSCNPTQLAAILLDSIGTRLHALIPYKKRAALEVRPTSTDTLIVYGLMLRSFHIHYENAHSQLIKDLKENPEEAIKKHTPTIMDVCFPVEDPFKETLSQDPNREETAKTILLCIALSDPKHRLSMREIIEIHDTLYPSGKDSGLRLSPTHE